jgi:endonuclease/exonuclease/phosphatase family metal-dependent hydrolase
VIPHHRRRTFAARLASSVLLAPVALLSALALSALVACGGVETDVSGEQDLSSSRIRVMEGNLSSGNLQSYLAPGSHIFAGLHPDIALVQEFNVGANSKLELDTWVKNTFGPSYTYFRESAAGFQIPNGVVSRFPILASGSVTDPKVGNRAFAYAKVLLPDGSKAWAFSLHLLTSGDRNSEAAALVKWIKATVPAGDHVIIGGDFNTGTRTEACVLTLGAVVSVAAPYPADNKGNMMTSGNRSKPHDWVLVDPALRALETPVLIGANSFPAGLVVDTRVYTPIADLAPALASDSGAPSMQHMGVVRDFLLPVK